MARCVVVIGVASGVVAREGGPIWWGVTSECAVVPIEAPRCHVALFATDLAQETAVGASAASTTATTPPAGVLVGRR